MARKTEEITRPDSYQANDHTAGHLYALHSKFSELIEILKPAVARAEETTSGDYNFRGNNTVDNARYKSPNDVLKWAERRVATLSEIAEKIDSKETTIIDGNALNCLRQVRAFCITFKSIGNNKYGTSANFHFSEKEISGLLSHKPYPKPNDAGIFPLLKIVLRDEPTDSKKDIGSIGKIIEVGKTLRDVMGARQELQRNGGKAPTKPQEANLSPEEVNAGFAALRNALQTEKPTAVAAARKVETTQLTFF